jgi:hypothetical protein
MKLSIILPFYKQAQEAFLGLLNNAVVFSRPDTEVIIVMDDNQFEIPMIQMAQQMATGFKTKIRIIVNDQKHEWRPPCKAINVGIRNSEGENIIVMSPETCVKVPTPDYFLNSVPEKKFVVGALCHISQGQPLTMAAFNCQITVGFGFLWCHRKDLESINGFDESRTGYGGDDDDIRDRLTHIAQPVFDFNIQLFHIRHDQPVRCSSGYEPHGNHVVVEQDWGKDFNRIAYDNTGTTP